MSGNLLKIELSFISFKFGFKQLKKEVTNVGMYLQTQFSALSPLSLSQKEFGCLAFEVQVLSSFAILCVFRVLVAALIFDSEHFSPWN